MYKNYDYQDSVRIYCIDTHMINDVIFGPWGIKDSIKILSNKSLNKYDT